MQVLFIQRGPSYPCCVRRRSGTCSCRRYSLLTDLFFVFGLDHLGADWVSCVKQVCKEVAISVLG